MKQEAIPVAVDEYVCPNCDDTFGQDYAVCDHHRDVHDGEISVEQVEMDPKKVEREPLLDSLYNLNKHAKKYAQLAEENYRQNKGATAKTNSIKKDALYALKSDVLAGLYDAGSVDEVERHLINKTEYWLFRIDNWTYHAPIESIEVDHSDISKGVDTPVVLDEFDKTAKKDRSSRSLKSSLLHVQDVLGLSANDYLSQTHVAYGQRSYFAGWQYL